MRIDTHQHFWNYDPVRDAWIDDTMKIIQRDFLPADLKNNLSQFAIDGTIAVQADQSEEETMFLIQLAEKNSWIKGVVGWVDLQADNIEERLKYFSNFKILKGFRHIIQVEEDKTFTQRKSFRNGINLLGQYGFSYDILISRNQLEPCIELTHSFPHVNFVLDHCGKPDIKNGEIYPWGSHIKNLAKNENVFCKISGLITEADHNNWSEQEIIPFLDIVFKEFGSDRIMFGSDWPVCKLAGSYERVFKLVHNYIQKNCKQDEEKIFGTNAITFYKI